MLTDEDKCIKTITALISFGFLKIFLLPYLESYLKIRNLRPDVEKRDEKEKVPKTTIDEPPQTHQEIVQSNHV